MFEQSALVCIDIQKGFNEPYWGKRNNPAFEQNVKQLLDWFRSRNLPVIHIQHRSTEDNSPLRPERPGVDFMPFSQPVNGEACFSKNVNSAFIGTDLQKYLTESGIRHLYLAGLTTDHCVSTTARMARNLGFDVTIVSDAVATFDKTDHLGNHYPADLIHQTALASLFKEFSDIKPLSELLRH